MIIARNWKRIERNGKRYVAFEKWNDQDPNDASNNGIYVYSAIEEEFDERDIRDGPKTKKVETTTNPTVSIDVEANDDTIGVTWVEQIPTGLLINLSETFYGGSNNFIICRNPTLLPNGEKMEGLDLDITKNSEGKYEYTILYTWLPKDSRYPLGGSRRHCNYDD